MSHNGHPHLYRQENLDLQFPPYADFSDRYTGTAAGEPRTVLYSSSPSQMHPHPLFTRQDNPTPEGPSLQNRPLDPHGHHSHHQVYQSPSPLTNIHAHHHHQPNHSVEPQSWPQFDHAIHQPFPQNGLQFSYAPFPSPSPFPPARLSPPPVHHQSFHFKGTSQTTPSTTASSRMTLAGSLDPATGIFYRTPEHPRLRTAQACEKCRTRKAKCSGEHPSCKRCITRGLVCEYAKEGRVRGPNKPKPKVSAGGTAGNDVSTNITSATNNNGRSSSRHRASSSNSSAESSDHPNLHRAGHDALGSSDREVASAGADGRQSLASSRRSSFSMSGHRSSRPNAQDLQLETAATLFRLSSGELSRSGSVTPAESLNFSPFAPHHTPNAEIIHDDNRQQQYHLQRSMMSHSHGTMYSPLSPSTLSLKRVPRGMTHSEGGHPLSLPTPPPHDLVHVGLPADSVDPALSESELMYPPGAYYDVSSGQHLDDRTDSLSRTYPHTRNSSCGSPLTSVSAGTTSSMGSPLTPASTIPSSSLHALHPTQQHHPYIHSDENQHEKGLDLHFDLDPALAPTPSTGQQHMLLSEQENHQVYHPSVNMSVG